MPRKAPWLRPNLAWRPPPPDEDLTGEEFEEWTVLAYAGTADERYYRCACSCGHVGLVRGGELRRRRTRSCGHLTRALKHGLARKGKRHPLYGTWQSMCRRCADPENAGWPNYGGRGIRVCKRWRESVAAFVQDVERLGPRPPGHTLDRIENDGDYEPGNVRWAPAPVQRRNQRRVTWVTIGSRRMCLKDWCAELGKNYATVKAYTRRGRTPIEALLGRQAA
jgi:hypothetical protein